MRNFPSSALETLEFFIILVYTIFMKQKVNIYDDRIVQDPKIMVGKPIVKGTRIPVERVLWHLEENDRVDLFAAFPELTEEDVKACLAYARIVVERQYQQNLDAQSVQA